MTKTQLRQVVDKLPDEIEIDAFFERVLLVEKLAQAEREFAAGQEIPHEEIEREFK